MGPVRAWPGLLYLGRWSWAGLLFNSVGSRCRRSAVAVAQGAGTQGMVGVGINRVMVMPLVMVGVPLVTGTATEIVMPVVMPFVMPFVMMVPRVIVIGIASAPAWIWSDGDER